MLLHFFLRFKSIYGQNISLVLHEKSESHPVIEHVVDLHYVNAESWQASVTYEKKYTQSKISYSYLLRDNGSSITDKWSSRDIVAENDEVFLYDDWQQTPVENTVFNSRAFTRVLNKEKKVSTNQPDKNATHRFYVHTRQMPNGKSVCLLGSSASLGGWDVQKPVMLYQQDDVWVAAVNLSKDKFPIEYKFAVYDEVQQKAVYFEEISNRILNSFSNKESNSQVHAVVDFKKQSWRGAGVNVQLSSLKTEKSWGVGDFIDLNLLTDWSVAAGMKMIQLLPINDTTSTYTSSDSYPYSAISAFALHPIFLNIVKLAELNKVQLPGNLLDTAQKLNELPTLDYENVFKLKMEAARLVFERMGTDFLKDKSYRRFYDENRHWLMAYAAFCFLRDKFQTADFSKWEAFAAYDEHLIEKSFGSKSEYFGDIAFHYFVQYHLHLQLSDAVSYAHQSGVIMKGDLPIGVGRFSMDTWMNPTLFHLDKQAGAPPDAFAKKGQNWSFPTYNWDAMKADNYSWWRQRLTHMSNYFDATRIDHVLGFFRIWSVPMHAIEGIFGVFVPSIAYTKDDFIKAGLHFDEKRFCEPYITDELLVNVFGDKIAFIKEQFMDGNAFKEELNTQRKIEQFSNSNKIDSLVKQKLFDLLGEVILFKDEKHEGHYHFRIDIHDTTSFKKLSYDEQEKLNRLYVQYFYEKQNDLWYRVAQEKLDAIQQSSDMMICAEDLGMVPDMVEDVLKSREMLALQVQRMPKKSYQQFSHPNDAPYLSVVTPSTHDMSTIRQWWEEDTVMTQRFYNDLLLHSGKAPQFCEPEICKEIIHQHLESPAMWSVFLLQDLLSIDGGIRRMDPSEERINNPADPNHYWNYRMHITLESLIEKKSLSKMLHSLVSNTQRC